MALLVLTLLVAGAATRLDSTAAQTVCPAATEASNQLVADLVRSPDRAATRQKLGLPALAITRVLNDSQDATVCSRISQFVETRTSNREPVPAGKVYIDLRWTPVYVLDSNLNMVAGLAM
ncbi:MAG TPA: hypothetical protein VHG35_18905 [Gemmatimonadales bacterium]|nr:hypothetical protein [Gemmatimonadales bacterium]